MALTADQELLEHQLRVEQMKSTIDVGRVNIDKMRADLRWENRKFFVQAVVGIAAAVGAGAALGNYLAHNAPNPPAPVAPPPQIIYLVPGQAPPKG